MTAARWEDRASGVTASPSRQRTSWAPCHGRWMRWGLALTVLFAAHAAQAKTISLFQDAPVDVAKSASEIDGTLPSHTRARAVLLAPAIGDAESIGVGDTLELALFDGAQLVAEIEGVTTDVNGTVLLRGRVQGFPLSLVTISTNGGVSLGSVEIPELGAFYHVQFGAETNTHYVLERDAESLAAEAAACDIPDDAETLAPLAGQKAGEPVGDPQAPAVIDVMVVYTPAARAWADGNRGSVANVISQAMGRAQTTLSNSNTGVTLSLVHSAEVNYTESGCADLDLRRLTASPTYNPYIGNYYCFGQTQTVAGYMDEVHEWRDQYGADLVALFANEPGTGGIAWQLYISSGSKNTAFSISRIQQVDSSFTFIHELGHNVGCGHNKDQNFQPGPGLFSYSGGGRWIGATGIPYASVLSYPYGQYYDDGQYHSQVAFLSDPDILFSGVPTGDITHANNAQTLRLTKHAIAAYRGGGDYVLTFQTDGTSGATLSGTTTQTIIPGASSSPVTAHPPANGTFTGWRSGGSVYSFANPLTIANVSASLSLTATFATTEHTLTYSSAGGGTISGPAQQTVSDGETGASVTAVPNAGYHFDRWSDGRTDNPRTDSNVTASLSVSAIFVLNQYTLTYAPGAHGSLTGPDYQTVNHGANATPVTITPEPGYAFLRWSDGVTSNPRTETNVTASVNVTAEYSTNQVTLTYSAGAHGTLSGSPVQTIPYGGNGSPVTVTADPGHTFIGWSDGKNANPRTDANVTASLNVTAVYSSEPIVLTYSAGAYGSLTGPGFQTVNYGENGTPVTVTPNPGYAFLRWSDGITDNPRTDRDVVAPINVSAVYTGGLYTLSYAGGAHGTIAGEATQQVPPGGAGTPVTAAANAGYRFVQWSDGRTANPRTDTNVQQSFSVTAQYAPEQHVIRFRTSGNGSISGPDYQTVTHGENGTPVTAVPFNGYHFNRWSDGATANPRIPINVTSDYTVYAEFEPGQHTLRYTAGAHGSLTGELVQERVYGESGSPVTAHADEGYHFDQWSDGRFDNPRIDAPVASNVDVVAEFAINAYTLSYAAGNGGTLNGPTSQSVSHGQDGAPVTAVPNEGAEFVGWSDGVTTNPRQDVGVTGPVTVSAVFAVTKYSLTYAAGEHGSLSGESSQVVQHGQDGSAVTAIPDAGYAFTAWSDGLTSNPRADVAVTHDIAVTAAFAPIAYTLSYAAGAGGAISGPAAQDVAHGSDGAAVTAVPDEHHHFVQWSDGRTDNPRTDLQVLASLSVTAEFAVNRYALVYSAGQHGALAGPALQEIPYGADGEPVTAIANEGHHFAQWSDGATDNPRSDRAVKSALEVVAEFAPNVYSLVYTAGEIGSVSGAGTQSVAHGADGEAVTATPAEGYHFVAWSDGSTANPRIDTAVTTDVQVEAIFGREEFTLIYRAPATGSLEGATVQSVEHGGAGTPVTAVPTTGFGFSQWSDGVTQNPRVDANVNASLDVAVIFTPTVYTLRYTAGPNGAVSGATVQDVEHGADGATVTATPAAEFRFAQWSDGATENPRTDLAVTGPIDVTAQFERATVTLHYTAGPNGTLDGLATQTVSVGANGGAVTAIANEHFRFVRWSDGSTDNPRVDAAVVSPISVTAEFTPIRFALTYTGGAVGSVEGATSQTVDFGEDGEPVRAEAPEGYHFVEWSDGSTENPRTDLNITQSLTVTAVFAVNRYTLEYFADAHGALEGAPVQTVSHGGDGTAVTAVPEDGYAFTEWSDGSTDNPRIDAGVKRHISAMALFEKEDVAYVPPVPLCDLLAAPDVALMEMRAAMGILKNDLEGLGIPDEAALAIMDYALCEDVTGPYEDAAYLAYEGNALALDGVLAGSSFAPHRDILAVLMATSTRRVSRIVDILALWDFDMEAFVAESVACDDFGCTPTVEKGPLGEPFAGDGDLDGDGVTNMAEYANIVAAGGDIVQFAQAALDPASTGEITQSGEGCYGASGTRPASSRAGDGLALVAMLLVLGVSGIRARARR